MCQQWLAHDVARCPLFPKAAGVTKWSECCCLIHTCYDAAAEGIRRDKKTAPTYKDFVSGEQF
ncbi:MAG: hypothetical protein A3J70_12810 [Elusimicrobia bacterium RIFCSPHIGHO2_02_FULL_61_10]|nr:MAG: hypothetical protein A3J70_12810 [Elusimicrobia bacterium RIFCSPHIGHO2_02_FULL_61_10]